MHPIWFTVYINICIFSPNQTPGVTQELFVWVRNIQENTLSLVLTWISVLPCIYYTASHIHLDFSFRGQTDGESLLYKVKMSGPSVDPCRTKVDKQRASDWQLQHFLDKWRLIWEVWFYSLFLYWKNQSTSSKECQMPFWDQKQLTAPFSIKLRFNLSKYKPPVWGLSAFS